jgi:hypothetical protein
MRCYKYIVVVWLLVSLQVNQVYAQVSYITREKKEKSFSLVSAGKAVSFFVDDTDYAGVMRATKDLQQDIARVSDVTPQLIVNNFSGGDAVIIGTLGKSKLIDQLVAAKKLNVKDIAGKWETFVIQVIDNPMVGIHAERSSVYMTSRGRLVYHRGIGGPMCHLRKAVVCTLCRDVTCKVNPP